MRYVAVATDYDNTLAVGGRVEQKTIAALERLNQSGRKIILVTGRRLPDILDIFPEIGLCERVVADNGAVLYRPATREQIALATPIPPGSSMSFAVDRLLTFQSESPLSARFGRMS